MPVHRTMKEGGLQMEPEQGEQRRASGNRLFTFLIIGVIVLVILGAFTLFQRRAQYHALAEETEALAIPTVAVIHPTAEVAQEDLVLPGTLQAYVDSPIHARTNGYLREVVPRHRQPSAKRRALGGD